MGKSKPRFSAALDSSNNPNSENQRASWVRDILGLMTLVILVASAVIAAVTIAGYFAFVDTLPIYVLLALAAPAWYMTGRGGWKWTRVIPELMCFALGIYSSVLNGYDSVGMLFYPMAVLLAGTLVNNRMGFLSVLACALAYAGFGFLHSGFSAADLPQLVTFGFALLGFALIRWYAYFRFLKIIAALTQSNRQLQSEIARREQAEQTQREQEAQLRRLAENTTDLVAETDGSGRILYASPSHQTSLGYAPETLLETGAAALLHPDDLPAVREAVYRAGSTRTTLTVQARVRRQDGEHIWVETFGTPLYGKPNVLTGFILASRDITLQRQAEMTLLESEKKFRRIIEQLPLGVHMYALEDGQLIFRGYNPAAEEILGVDHAPLIGKPIEANFPGLVSRGVVERFYEVARSGGLWTEEHMDYALPPIRGIFEVHAFQTEPGKMVAVFSDITQRIQAAEALRSSEEKFSTAFLTSPDSININRLDDGTYLDVNQGFTRLMGYTREEAIGRSSLDLNIWGNPQDRERMVRGLLEDGVVENLEAGFRRKNGEVGVGLMSARMIMVQGEKCILSITREITNWIQAELDLREAHAQLERAYEATLQGWARALELRERETADHSRRVVEHTLRTARAMGIDGVELVHLGRGALLHDIGKMGVPDEILLKPGRLTPDEWVIMRQHPEYARAMLRGIDYLHPSIAIPYSHHERWDGAGYPQGLKGKDIPLPARIFAIVDVFDALTHDRPYRPAWSEAEASRYLIEQKGKQFDTEIVDLFLGVIRQAGSTAIG